MSAMIVYTVGCGNCGDGTIRIDLELAAGQATFACDNCGATVYTGDLDTSTEGGGSQHRRGRAGRPRGAVVMSEDDARDLFVMWQEELRRRRRILAARETEVGGPVEEPAKDDEEPQS